MIHESISLSRVHPIHDGASILCHVGHEEEVSFDVVSLIFIGRSQ